MSAIRTRIETSFNAQGLMSTLGAKLRHIEAGEVHIRLAYDASRQFVSCGCLVMTTGRGDGHRGREQLHLGGARFGPRPVLGA
jgi:hypothetical protein